jgi:4-amino-4-deoxy-L-arabinose transferase-like glycosyltransferase
MTGRSAASRTARLATGLRRVPVEAILVGLGLLVLLAAFAGADPPRGVTGSVAPFTDEAFNVVNARNFIQLGRFSTDEWNLHLVNLPFSLLQAAWFAVTGVGIVQARLVAIACSALTATTLVLGLRGTIGRAAATFAGLAFAASGLVLVYGRLTFLEDLVALGLAAGTVVIARDGRLTLRWGLVSGACYAIGVGAKPSAGFAVVGIVAVLSATALIRRDPGLRRWLGGAIAAIALAGLAWVVVVWMPNRDAVSMDLRIWAAENLSLAPIDALKSVSSYLRSNDNLYGAMLGPLLLLGVVGFGAVAVLRRRLGSGEARLAAAAIGWLAFGFGILLIASYRPNRYVVPLEPALAILAAIGLRLAIEWLRDRMPSGGAAPADPPRTRRVAAWSGPVLAGLVTAVAVVPGLTWYASWARSATYDLPAIQASFATAVPDGERVAGRESALYLMRSKAITLITQPGGGAANNENLYAQGVRLYLLPANDPAPPGVSAGVWAARESLQCGEYGGLTECLFRVR